MTTDTFSDAPLYPEVEVQLSNKDGNAGAIMGRVTTALRKQGVETKEVNKFRAEAMGGNYDELLQTCMKWVTIT